MTLTRISFATVTALWTLVTLLIKLIRILLKWNFIQDQILVAMLRKRSNFCRGNVVLVAGLERSYWKNIHPFYRDLGNWASPVLMWTLQSKFWQLIKKYRGEISEPEPTRFTGLLWGGSNSMSMRKPIKTKEVKSPIWLKLGRNSYLGNWLIVAKKYVKMFYSSQVRVTPRRSGNLTLIYASRFALVFCFTISTVATVMAFFTFVTLLIKLICVLPKWRYKHE